LLFYQLFAHFVCRLDSANEPAKNGQARNNFGLQRYANYFVR